MKGTTVDKPKEPKRKTDRDWTFQLTAERDTPTGAVTVYRRAYIDSDGAGIHLVGKDETPLSLAYITENAAYLRTLLLKARDPNEARRILEASVYKTYATRITEI